MRKYLQFALPLGSARRRGGGARPRHYDRPMLGLLFRPFRLIGLLITIALVVGGIWLWRRAHSSTPVAEDRAVAAFRAGDGTTGTRPGAPRPGVYVYSVEGEETAGAGPAHVTRALPGRAPMIARLAPGGYETELRLSEEHLEGFSYRLVPAGTRTVASRTKLTFLGIGQDDRRDMRPPPLRLPATFRAGQTWRDTYRAGSLVIRVRSRVVRSATVRLGGRSIPCWVVRITSDTEGTHPGTRVETLWWSPPLGLALRRTDDLQVGGVFSLKERATMRLLSATPRT